MFLRLFKNKFIDNNIFFSTAKDDFFEYDLYESEILEFNSLSYDLKESLSEFLNFDKKYDRSIYIEICELIAIQINKVTKSFEILTENDIQIVLNATYTKYE